MPALASTLQGLLIGVFFFLTRFDAVWYPHFGTDPSRLKSKVASSQRSEASSFYKSMVHPPPRFLYTLLGVGVLVLVSLIGQSLQSPKKRVVGILAALLTASALGLVGWKQASLIKGLAPRYIRPDDEAQILYGLALWNAVTLACLLGSALLSIGLEEAQIEEDQEEDKVKTS